MGRKKKPPSQRIRERRLELELSQAEAAERAGIRQPNWARLERADERADQGTWSVDVAKRVAKALELSITDLIT